MLQAQYDRLMERHVIISRLIESPGLARFVVGRPGDSAYRAEVVVLCWGHLLVHGDVDTVVFGRCSYRGWRQIIAWLADTNYDYAEEKAAIGTGCQEMAREFEAEIAVGDVLWLRREKHLSAAAARTILGLVMNGDAHGARQMIYDETDDGELCDIGMCTAQRVFMAQAILRRLDALLLAEEAVERAPQAPPP
jgi:hypothetical protein